MGGFISWFARGSAFFVRPLGERLADRFEMSRLRLVSSGLARAWSSREQVRSIWMIEHFDSPDYFEI